MIKKIIFIFVLSLFFPFLVLANNNNIDESSWEVEKSSYVKAEVLSVKEKTINENSDLDKEDYSPVGEFEITSVQELKLKILSGKNKNKEISIKNTLSTNPLKIHAKKGALLMLEEDKFKNGEYQYSLVDYYRVPVLYVLFFLFILVILLIGGKTGFRTLGGLFFSVFLIFYWFIPSVLNGSNPLILAIIISILSTIVTLYLIAGKSKKTLSAILGTLGGILFAFIITYIFTHLAKLNGLCTEDSRLLFSKHNDLNPLSIFYAGILIGTLGAVMDASMSIASAISELKKSNKDASFYQLFQGGYAVGKDIMGTMSNTLILAYVSVSLPLLLLYTDFGGGFQQFLNFDFVADEMIRSLAGSIGLILAIPLTALISAYLEKMKIKK